MYVTAPGPATFGHRERNCIESVWTRQDQHLPLFKLLWLTKDSLELIYAITRIALT